MLGWCPQARAVLGLSAPPGMSSCCCTCTANRACPMWTPANGASEELSEGAGGSGAMVGLLWGLTHWANGWEIPLVGSIALSGPGRGFQLLCLCPRNTEPCAGPPVLSVSAHITAGFCSFNTLMPDSTGVAQPVLSSWCRTSAESVSDPRRAGCSQVDAGSPSHWIMPCPGCLAPLCSSRRAGTAAHCPCSSS